MALRLKTDWVLFAIVVALVCFGLVMVYSASSVMAEVKMKVTSVYFFIRQLAWAVVAFFFLMYFKRKDYLDLKSPAWAFTSLGAVLMMLVAVYFLDARTHRWFRFGTIGSIQPSEFAKPALILFLAYFLSQRARSVNDRQTILQVSLALVFLAATVVLADLGTAIVLIATAGVLFYVAGLEKRYLFIAVGCLALFAGIAIAMKPYRVARMIAALDPEYKVLNRIDRRGIIKQYANESITTRDAGYQAWQSRVALGSGGPLGLGLMRGRQKNGFLPEAHTDFIYAVIGEELGLWGCSGVLAAFMIILWRGFRLCWVAGDEFGRYLALGVTASIVIQALVNMSVVLDMGPTKGIPLPMISAGGSSLLSTLVCLGMLMSVSAHTE